MDTKGRHVGISPETLERLSPRTKQLLWEKLARRTDTVIKQQYLRENINVLE
jgi:hypothetical protein